MNYRIESGGRTSAEIERMLGAIEAGLKGYAGGLRVQEGPSSANPPCDGVNPALSKDCPDTKGGHPQPSELRLAPAGGPAPAPPGDVGHASTALIIAVAVVALAVGFFLGRMSTASRT